MYSQATHDYLTSSVVTVPKGVTIDPNLPVHPTFLYESIWCFVGLFLLVRYLKKRRFAGDIALRYLICTVRAASGSKPSAPTACCWCPASACGCPSWWQALPLWAA